MSNLSEQLEREDLPAGFEPEVSWQREWGKTALAYVVHGDGSLWPLPDQISKKEQKRHFAPAMPLIRAVASDNNTVTRKRFIEAIKIMIASTVTLPPDWLGDNGVLNRREPNNVSLVNLLLDEIGLGPWLQAPVGRITASYGVAKTASPGAYWLLEHLWESACKNGLDGVINSNKTAAVIRAITALESIVSNDSDCGHWTALARQYMLVGLAFCGTDAGHVIEHVTKPVRRALVLAGKELSLGHPYRLGGSGIKLGDTLAIDQPLRSVIGTPTSVIAQSKVGWHMGETALQWMLRHAGDDNSWEAAGPEWLVWLEEITAQEWGKTPTDRQPGLTLLAGILNAAFVRGACSNTPGGSFGLMGWKTKIDGQLLATREISPQTALKPGRRRARG